MLLKYYYDLREIRNAGGFAVYSGKHVRTHKDAFLFRVNLSGPGVEGVLKEHERLDRFHSKHVLTSRWIDRIQEPAPGIVLVYEPEDTIPFRSWSRTPLEIPDFLSLAVQSGNAVKDIHRKGLILHFIIPDLFFINPNSRRFKIADLCLYSSFSRIYALRSVDSPPYISPEQTGRMNRETDYRSDFYVLGVVFYEWLTGRSPFPEKARMEMLHSHIAETPVPPSAVREEIPVALSDIVMKLLNKSPDDRYQSASGLVRDLDQCRRMIEETGRIELFTPGLKDSPEQLKLSETIYEREPHFQVLLDGYEKAARGETVFMIVSGASGVGKSRLVNSLYDPVSGSGACFISGKFDSLQSGIPYDALAQALRDAAGRILKEGDESITWWKDRFVQALDVNCRILTDIAPEFQYILGTRSRVPDISPIDARNRFKLVFEKVIDVLTDEGRPLVLFLDDLQWADSGSLDLIRSILTEYDTRYFYFIGCYRDDEPETNDLLIQLLSTIPKSGVFMNSIPLAPLSPETVMGIIADTLKQPLEAVSGLGDVIHAKTGGNPFFVERFLETLASEGLLHYDYDEGDWRWDMELIRRRDIDGNVVDLMCRKIADLPRDTRWILETAACFGTRFDVETVAYMVQKNVEDALSDLEPAVENRLIWTPESNDGLIMEFVHDRIRQTVYSMIPDPRKESCHLQIGEIMLQNDTVPNTGERLFFIVNHLNLGKGRISKLPDKKELARLNLKAGRRAKQSTAYDSALRYFRTASDLLGNAPWDIDHDLAMNLYSELVECSSLCGYFDEAEVLSDKMLEHARTRMEEADAYNLKVNFHTIQGDVGKAVYTGLEGLNRFGVNLHRNPGKSHLMAALFRFKISLGRRRIEDIIHMPRMEDPEMIQASLLLSNIGTPAFYLNPRLFAYLVVRGVTISLKYGIPDSLPLALAPFGVIVGSALGKYDLGYRIGLTALELAERFSEKEFRAKTNFAFAYFILHWRKHARENIHYFRTARGIGLQAGDLSYVGHSINSETLYRLMIGDNIDLIFKDHDSYQELIQRTREPFIRNDYLDNFRFHQALKGLTDRRTSLDGDGYDQNIRLENLKKDNNYLALFLHLLLRMKLFYLFGEFEDARRIGEEMEIISDTPRGTLHEAEYAFFYALSLAACARPALSGKKRKYKRTLRKYTKKMKRWSYHCPDNFRHKYLFMAAEISALNGRSGKAALQYQQAARSAEEHGYIQNQAMINEAAGVLFLKLGAEKAALFNLTEAYECYSRWGATGKTAEMKERYSAFLNVEPVHRAHSNYGDADMDAVVASLQTISTEIVMARLLERIIRTVVETAGADMVMFISVKDNECFIEAEKKAGREKIDIYNASPMNGRNDIFLPVINYVKGTRQYLVFDDVSREREFASHPYVKTNRPKSVLCLPVVRQSAITSILYLENTAVAGAFTENRINLLQLMGSQFAISFENARLYEYMRKKEKDLLELSEKREELERIINRGSSVAVLLSPESPWKVMFVSDNIRRFEYDPGEFLREDKYYADIIHPEDLPMFNQSGSLSENHGDAVSSEYRIITKSGAVRRVEDRRWARRNADGSIVSYQCIITDVTERKKLEDALTYRLESERLIASISAMFLTSPIDRFPEKIDEALRALGEFVDEDRTGLFQVSEDGRIAGETNEWRAQGVESRIDSFQDLVLDQFPWLTRKLNAFELIHIQDIDELPDAAANLKQFLKSRGVFSFVLIPMFYSGALSGFIGFEAVRQKKTRDPEHIRLLRTVSDILANACAGMRTERERMMYQSQLRSMSAELSFIEERERRRIAVELHDRIGHALANCAMKLGTLKNADLTTEQAAAWADIKHLIDQSIKDTHSLTFELSPPILYDLGLEAAIDWLVEQTGEQHGLQIEFEDDMKDKPLDTGFRVLLFQAARELLFNIVKHAKADYVLVDARKAGNTIKITIEDNGVGFDLEEKRYSDKKGGFGLFSIRERLKHQGGNFDIDTAPGKGTRITMSAPLTAGENEEERK